MNTLLLRAGELLGGLAAPKLVSRETAVLLILAASLLVFRTLRERCLMVPVRGQLPLAWDGVIHLADLIVEFDHHVLHCPRAVAPLKRGAALRAARSPAQSSTAREPWPH